MKKLTILFICLSAIAFGQDMKYDNEVEQQDKTIAVGDTIVTVTLADTLLYTPAVHIVQTDGGLKIKDVTKHNFKVVATDTTGRSFKVAITEN